MTNWNYDLAKAYTDNIKDATTRRLTEFFLGRFVFLLFHKHAVPENLEIDLLCYTKITEKIVEQHDVLERCLHGEETDPAVASIIRRAGRAQ